MQGFKSGHGHVYWKNSSTGELRVVDIKEDGTPSDAKAGAEDMDGLSKDVQVAFIQDPLSSLEECPPGIQNGFCTDLEAMSNMYLNIPAYTLEICL